MIKFLTLATFFNVMALGQTLASGAIDCSKFPQPSGKIIRRETTEIELIPWQVSLGSFVASRYEHICGSSIITVQDIDIEIRHPEYDFLHNVHVSFNDVGLIHVIKKFEFGSTRQSVRLQDEDSSTIEGMMAKVSGRGWPTSETLRTVELSIVKKWQCNICLSTELYPNMNDKGQICAHGDGIRSSCNGDSGRPVTINGTLVGVLSWVPLVKTSTYLGKPLSLSEVAHYRKWIWQTVRV